MAMAAAVAVAAAGLVAVASLTVQALHGRSLDLAPLFVAGRLAWAGQQAHLFVYQPLLSPEVQDEAWSAAAAAGGYRDWLLAYVFPPVWAELFAWPAAHLDWRWFRAGFALANAGALALGCALAARLWAPPGRAMQAAAISLAVLPFAWPAACSAFFNQVQPWAALALLAALHEAERDRPARAGMLLALAGALKLTPALMGVWWLITGRWRAAGWALGAGAALFALNLAVAGIGPTRAFIDQIGRVGELLQAGGVNQSLLIPAAHLFGVSLPPGVGVAFAPPGARLLAWGGALAALAFAAIRLRGAGAEARRGRLMPVILILTSAVSPLAWTHYFPFLVPLAVGLGFRLRHGPAVAAAALGALVLATGLFFWAPALHDRVPQLTLVVALGLAGAALFLPDRKASSPNAAADLGRNPALRPPRAEL
ncbi:MAG: glycosyltransferase 87 family protein [Pseudomonadota bacterium]|nr:glycosyltransferase 87 family protein [Pseudomonadota bacterium]MEE3100948.1 glycosyltransferase 87 family protein [Pseudomonadota bacterium]